MSGFVECCHPPPETQKLIMAIPLIMFGGGTHYKVPLPPPSAGGASQERRSNGIYVAAVPLRAGGPGQRIMSAAYSLNLWELQHFMVLIASPPYRQAFAFDFQPQEPENIYVALTALSGGAVPGSLRVRKLTKLPKNKCWLVGLSDEDSITKANKFNDVWSTDLKIGQHDCRDYTNGLVEFLTGEKYVLDRLRRGSDS